MVKFGVRRQSAAATALWIRPDLAPFEPTNQVASRVPSPSRQVGTLPAHSRLSVLYFSGVPFYFSFMPKCLTCGKAVEWQDNPWRPFCSERCKLIDFDKWTSDEYRVPGQQINPGEVPSSPSARDTGTENEENER
jgi:hypothetical protein